MVDFKRFVGGITFECCCWNKLLTTKATCWIARDTVSSMAINFSFYKFFIVMDGVSANGIKAIMGSVLKVSLQLWFACYMCQCFVIISFKFGNDRLYVTDKGMHCLSWRKFSGLAVVFLECWAYSLNSKCLAVGNTFL